MWYLLSDYHISRVSHKHFAPVNIQSPVYSRHAQIASSPQQTLCVLRIDTKSNHANIADTSPARCRPFEQLPGHQVLIKLLEGSRNAATRC